MDIDVPEKEETITPMTEPVPSPIEVPHETPATPAETPERELIPA